MNWDCYNYIFKKYIANIYISTKLRPENRERRADNREQITENKEQRTDNSEQRTDNSEQITENNLFVLTRSAGL